MVINTPASPPVYQHNKRSFSPTAVWTGFMLIINIDQKWCTFTEIVNQLVHGLRLLNKIHHLGDVSVIISGCLLVDSSAELLSSTHNQKWIWLIFSFARVTSKKWHGLNVMDKYHYRVLKWITYLSPNNSP